MDVPAQQKKRVSGDYQMFIDGFSLPWPDPDFYTVWFSSGGPLYAKPVGFADDKLDKLLEEGRTTLDQNKRKAIYLKCLLWLTPDNSAKHQPQTNLGLKDQQ
jgi:peptide/nickel transport system substrate-binding protein